MKNAAIIVLGVLCAFSLALNVWFYSQNNNLSTEISDLRSDFRMVTDANQQWRTEYEALELTMHDLDKENHQLKSQNLVLTAEIQNYEIALAQIKQEAEEAQQFNLWSELLSLIFSF